MLTAFCFSFERGNNLRSRLSPQAMWEKSQYFKRAAALIKYFKQRKKLTELAALPLSLASSSVTLPFALPLQALIRSSLFSESPAQTWPPRGWAGRRLEQPTISVRSILNLWQFKHFCQKVYFIRLTEYLSFSELSRCFSAIVQLKCRTESYAASIWDFHIAFYYSNILLTWCLTFRQEVKVQWGHSVGEHWCLDLLAVIIL